MRRLLEMLGLYRPKANPELLATRARSEIVLTKANRVLVEEKRIEQLRGSFQRADRRLGG